MKLGTSFGTSVGLTLYKKFNFTSVGTILIQLAKKNWNENWNEISHFLICMNLFLLKGILSKQVFPAVRRIWAPCI